MKYYNVIASDQRERGDLIERLPRHLLRSFLAMTLGLLVVFVCIGSICTITISPAFAQQLDLSISPSIIEVTAAPGSEVATPITLTNETENSLTLRATFKPFSINEDGSVKLGNDQPDMLSWLHFKENNELLPDEFTLRPHEKAQIDLAIAVPKEASLSDYPVTSLFLAKSKDETTNEETTSTIEAGVGSHILLSVSQNPSLPFSTMLKEFSMQAFSFEEPLTFRLIVENQGDYFTHAKGEIQIVDRTGKKLQTIAIPDQFVLAHSVRNLTSQTRLLPSKNLFGKYTAKAVVYIGDQTLAKEVTFYVIPKYLPILVFTVIVVLASISRKFHLYAKWRQTFRSRRSRRH